MAEIITRIQSFGIGWLIALVILILCVILMFLGATLTPFQVLALISALALAQTSMSVGSG